METLKKIWQRYPRFWYFLAGALLLTIIIVIAFPSLTTEGHIVFGDIDFGFLLDRYLERMLGTWNELWSNPNFFNLSRLPVIAPLYLFVSALGVGISGLLKLFIFLLLFLGAYGVFCFLSSVFFPDNDDRPYGLPRWGLFFIAIGAGVLYSLNPWVLTRIQHVYLLVGHALMPFMFLLTVSLTETHLVGLKTADNSIVGQIKALFPPSVLTRVFLLAVLWTLSVASVHYLFFTFFLIAFWGIYRIIVRIGKMQPVVIKAIIARLSLVGIITLFLSAYFLFPQLGASFIQDIEPNNINTVDSLVLFSRNSSLKHVLYLSSYWWPLFDLQTLSFPFWIGGGVLMVIIWFGSLFNRRNKFVIFNLVWAALFAVLATGTKVFFPEFFTWLVFDFSLASTVGFLFRDPNKLVGLMILSYSILFGLNFAWIIEYFMRVYFRVEKEILAAKLLFHEYSGRVNFWKPILVSLPIITGAALFFYLQPFQVHFAQNLYKPVKIPQSYVDVNTWLKKNPQDKKTVWFPRNERVISPGEQFATTDWNKGKPTSGLDVFSAQTKTYNTTEGATAMMGHLFDFFYKNLKEGLSTNVLRYLQSMSIQNIIYHTDNYGFEEIDEKTLKHLVQQQDIDLIGKIGDQHFFQTENPVSYFHFLPRALFSTEGFSVLDIIGSLPGYSFRDYATFFLQSQERANMLASVEEGDLVNFRFFNDLILSQVKPEELVAPFDFVNHSDAFTRWAKNRITTIDWKWHLSHLGVRNWNWDFDFGKGVIFTYAPQMIDLEPYDDFYAEGETFFTTEDFQNKGEDFFLSTDPLNLKVNFAPEKSLPSTPFLKGGIFEGDRKFWKIVTSKLIPVEEKHGYSFFMSISGKNAKNLHGKVKYFDENEEEIGISYISSPKQVDTFNFTRFSGIFITPPKTKYIRTQIWSNRPLEKKQHWWIHDLEMRDLGEHLRPNTVTFEKLIPKSGAYKVFARVMHNNKGGQLRFKIGDQERKVITTAPNINQFFWENLGTHELRAGLTPFEVENLSGFNAVNVLAVVAEEDFENYRKKAEDSLKKTRTLYVIDPSYHSIYEGNPQSKEPNIDFTNGYAIQSDDGVISSTLDIAEEGTYELVLSSPPESQKLWGSIRVFVLDQKGSTLYEREVVQKSNQKKNIFSLGDYYLLPGKVQLKVVLEDQFPSLILRSSFHRFGAEQEWVQNQRFTFDSLDKDDKVCCRCQGLPDEYLTTDVGDEKTSLFVKKGCSCWWAIAATNIAPLENTENHIISFDVEAGNPRRKHFKLIFLDKNKVYKGYEIIDEQLAHEIKESHEWRRVEQIIEIPPETEFVQFQVWSRQNPFVESYVGIKELVFKNQASLPTVDSMVLFEKNDPDETIHTLFSEQYDRPKIRITSDKKTKKSFLIQFPFDSPIKRWVLQVAESYTPLWQLSIDGQKEAPSQRPLPQFQVLNSFVINAKSGQSALTGNIEFLPERFFVLGKGLSLLFLFVSFGLLLFVHRKSVLLQSLSQTNLAQLFSNWLQWLDRFITTAKGRK